MLEPNFKNYSLIFCVIGHEQGVVIVQECDRNFYVLCFWNVIIVYIH
jgi:hypothetical protein